jgi:sugar lactone lactonase YvrE
MRVVLDGLVMGESTRWHDDRLWFCDWGAGEIVVVDRERPEVVARIDDFPFCIDWLPDGQLLVITGRGLLLRREPDGSLITQAELTSLGGTHPWNDIAVDSRGHAYVNNIGFAFPGGELAPGLIALVEPDGTARQVADGLLFPNGMAVTPDDRTLIVAESYAGRLTAFTIAPDGSLGERRVWASLGAGVPDGICIDAAGAVWYADVPNKRCVRVREGGEVLRTVELDRGGFACAVGDGTLYAVTSVYPSSDGPAGQLVAIPLQTSQARWVSRAVQASSAAPAIGPSSPSNAGSTGGGAARRKPIRPASYAVSSCSGAAASRSTPRPPSVTRSASSPLTRPAIPRPRAVATVAAAAAGPGSAEVMIRRA